MPESVQQKFLEHLGSSQKEAFGKYLGFIDQGIARELARIDLPLSLYTEWYWKIDLHNLFHFLRLRLDEHAQKEIREYAIVMGNMVKTVCPLAWEAFEDYTLNAVTFSGPELEILRPHLTSVPDQPPSLTEQGLSKGEAQEFQQRLADIRDRKGK